MLFRVVIVMTTFILMSSVNASESDSDNRQTFELTPVSDVSYQPWSDSPPIEQPDVVPPPPPGPYISLGLSNINNGFSSEEKRQADTGQVSPLLRPDAPWPVKRDRPSRWVPEGEYRYAPDADAGTSSASINQPYRGNRMQPPRMYNRQYYQPRYYAPPQFSRQPMNQPYPYQQRPVWNGYSPPMSNYQRQAQQPVRR